MTDDLRRGSDQFQIEVPQTGSTDRQASESGFAHGESSAALGQSGAATVVSRPANGETAVVAPAADETFLLNFDPGAAQVQIEGVNLVLGFDDNGDGTVDSRIVFENLAQEGAAPVTLQIGGTEVASDILIGQALDLAGQIDGPLNTVAAGPGATGGGGSSYSDDLGDPLDLLAAQGIIPPVELQFRLIELDDETVALNQVDEVDGAAAGEPSVGLQVREDSGVKEDDRADLDISAATTSDGDTLTQVVITAPADWVLNATAGGDIASVAGDGSSVLTLTLVGGVTNFSGAIKAMPPADTDVDAVFTVAATAVDGLHSASGSNDFPVAVDAVQDEALELGTDGSTGGSEQAAVQTLSLGLDATPGSAGFGLSLAGGSDTDSSESSTVTLVLSEALPAGASLSSTAGTVTPTGDPLVYTITGSDLAAAIDGLQVEVPGGFEGTISGTVSTESREANTPGGAESGSGQEPDTSDNVSTDSVNFAVTVEGGEVSPEAVIGLPNGVAAIKEDSENNVVEFSASAGNPTDELTTVVIELPNVAPGDVDIAQINTDLGANGSAVVTTPGGVTTIEITVVDASDVQNFSSSFTLDAPDEDSDVDLAGVKITAQAKDTTEAGTTGSDDATTTIAVDAVLDEAGTATQGTAPTVSESGAAQEIDLDLSLGDVSAGFGHSGAGGEDTDGSEEVTAVTVTISEGVLELGAGAPAGSSLADNGGGSYTINVSDPADYGAAIAALEVEVPGGFDGVISGSIAVTTAEVSPSDGEPDGSDNTKTVVNSFTASVETGEVTPTASLALGGAAAGIKEDSTDNPVEFTAHAGDSTDELTTVVIKLPGVVAGSVDSLSFGDASKIAGTSITDDGTDTTITITLIPGVETLSGSFTLGAPDEDSDVDLTGVTITAHAQDKSDSSEIGSGGQTTDIHVDAVADGGALVGTDGYGVSTNGSVVDLDLTLTPRGHASGSPDDENGGGVDTDGSEEVTTIQVTLSGSPAISDETDANLVYDAGFGGVVDHVTNTLVWSFTGTEAQLTGLVQSLQVDPADDYEGTVSVKVEVTTTEKASEAGNPDAGDTNGVYGVECDDSDNSVTEDFTFNVGTEVVEPLHGKIVINEVGLGVSEEQNDGGFHVDAGLNFIEIRSIANNASGVNGKAIERLDIEIVGPDGTKVTIDLSTLSGATDQHGLAAKEYLVLYEDGTWAVYDSSGELKNNNSHGSYTSNSPWGFGETTSDKLAINMIQEISAGNFVHVDGLLANDADTGSLSNTANQIWEGAGSGSAAAASLFGGFVNSAQFNGMIGDQWAVLGSILAPGQSVLDDPELLNDAVNDGVDDATKVFARVYSENVPGQSHIPGDTVNGGTSDIDTNQELDWTTSNQSTQGGINQASGDLNPQDNSDDFDPAQGGASNDEIAGQTVIDASEGGEADTANEADDNSLEGGRGQDLLLGDNDDNLLHGGDHNDLLFGDQGDDRLEGEKGADLLTDVDGEDLLVGGAGDDILIGGEERLEGDVSVSGGDGGDLLVGDNIIAGQVPTFNVVYVIDRSGSMGNEFNGTWPESGEMTRLDHAKQAFLTINQQIIDAGFAGVVNIKVVPFSSWATDSSDLEFDRADDADLVTEINGLTAGGGTQYESPLNVAADWLLEGGRHVGSQNFIFFLSDGGDNYGLGGFNPYEIPGLVADLYDNGSGSPNISNLTIEAFGFGDSGASDFLPDELDQVEQHPDEGPNTGTDVSDADYATIVENPEDIEQIFSAISLTDENLGEDVILGGSHSDYIFGDTLVVDPGFGGSERDFCEQVLFEDEEGMALRLPLDTIGLSDWIEGGAGDDSVMGQGGDDTIIGQEGDDLVYGGDGDDLVRHTLTEETLGATGNHYDGGRDSDTLQLYLTGDQAANATIAQAVRDLGDFIAANSDPASISGNGAPGTSAELGLEIRNFEALEVYVDGVAVSPVADGVLVGSDLDEVLDGGAGADWLYARGGDDTVTGGSGPDTFVFVGDGSFQVDTITDFDTGEGDVIDLSGLLSDVPSGPDGADLDNYLSFVSDGVDTTISIDSDGTGGSNDFQIVIEGVDLNAGNTLDHEDVLNTLLTNGNLVAE